jgi:hypothetical protein
MDVQFEFGTSLVNIMLAVALHAPRRGFGGRQPVNPGDLGGGSLPGEGGAQPPGALEKGPYRALGTGPGRKQTHIRWRSINFPCHSRADQSPPSLWKNRVESGTNIGVGMSDPDTSKPVK